MDIQTYTFEDIKEGMTAETTVVVTEEMIASFAHATHDFHPLHTDADYAQAHGFDNIIAHGLLISSMSSSLIGMQLPGENAIVLSQEFKYGKPVYPNDVLSYSAVVKNVDDRFETIDVKIKVKNQKELTVASGSYKVKIRKV